MATAGDGGSDTPHMPQVPAEVPDQEIDEPLPKQLEGMFTML